MIRFYEVLRRGDQKGFTLIELLIVVAVIAILAVIAIPNFLNARKRASLSASKANLKNVATALETYQADNDSYPSSPGDTTLSAGSNVGLMSTYINVMPTDSSGGGYIYNSDALGVGLTREYQLRDPHTAASDTHRNSAGNGATAYVEEGGNVIETAAAIPAAP